MRAIFSLLTLIILAVLVVSIVRRGNQAAAVINSITGFFSESYRAILGEAPESSGGGRTVRRVRRRG